MGPALPYLGFDVLRAGRIHLYCPGCGRRQSNMRRDIYDPPSAVVMHLHCDSCGQGCKDGAASYLDAHGRFIGEQPR